MKIYGSTKTHLTLTAKAQRAYDNTDPLRIIEHDDGTYSIRGIEDRDGMTAADVNQWLEDLADEIAERDYDTIISKAKWWSIGTELHYGEEIPPEVEMDARRRDVSVHTGTNLSVLSDEDLVNLYDLAPDYGWLYDDAYDNGTSLADAIFRSADMTADDDLDAAVDVLRERREWHGE